MICLIIIKHIYLLKTTFHRLLILSIVKNLFIFLFFYQVYQIFLNCLFHFKFWQIRNRCRREVILFIFLEVWLLNFLLILLFLSQLRCNNRLLFYFFDIKIVDYFQFRFSISFFPHLGQQGNINYNESWL